MLTLRGPDELAELRRDADAFLVIAGKSDYVRDRIAGYLAALDWIDGRAAAPMSGRDVPATDDEMLTELGHAVDAEERARYAHEDGTFEGCVGELLSWVLGQGNTPRPL